MENCEKIWQKLREVESLEFTEKKKFENLLKEFFIKIFHFPLPFSSLPSFFPARSCSLLTHNFIFISSLSIEFKFEFILNFLSLSSAPKALSSNAKKYDEKLFRVLLSFHVGFSLSWEKNPSISAAEDEKMS